VDASILTASCTPSQICADADELFSEVLHSMNSGRPDRAKQFAYRLRERGFDVERIDAGYRLIPLARGARR